VCDEHTMLPVPVSGPPGDAATVAPAVKRHPTRKLLEPAMSRERSSSTPPDFAAVLRDKKATKARPTKSVAADACASAPAYPTCPGAIQRLWWIVGRGEGGMWMVTELKERARSRPFPPLPSPLPRR